MKLYVVGVPCAGKSSVCARINNGKNGIRAVDVDDEVIRLNGGTWPTIERKNAVIFPQILKDLLSAKQALVFNSFLERDHAEALRAAGFTIALLNVGEPELLRRHEQRSQLEGWSNREWFDWNQQAIRDLRDSGLIDLVIDAERPLNEVADDIVDRFHVNLGRGL